MIYRVIYARCSKFIKGLTGSCRWRFRWNATCNACLLRKDTAERGKTAGRRLQRLRARCEKRRLSRQKQASATKEVETTQSTAKTAATTAQLYTDTCPWCQGDVQSRVETGKVNHRHACGKQFRVQDGRVAGQTHPHTCPKCGTVIYSTKASGRIQSLHQTPNGRSCPQQQWKAVVSSQM